MSSVLRCQVCVWSLTGGVGDENVLPRGAASVYRHGCCQLLWGHVEGVGRGCRYGVSPLGCDPLVVVMGMVSSNEASIETKSFHRFSSISVFFTAFSMVKSSIT